MSQAAGLLDVTLAALKAAKGAGCKGFLSHGRVDLGCVIPFLLKFKFGAGKLQAGFSSWKEFGDYINASREEIKLAKDKRETMPSADAQRQASEACAFFFAELERGERELPPALAGGTATDIYKRLHLFTEGLRKSGKAKFEEVGK